MKGDRLATPVKTVKGQAPRTRMRAWVHENASLTTRELRQAAIFAFSNDTAMIHEAVAFLAQSERANDLHIHRRRQSRAFRELAEGVKPIRVLDFLANWSETVDGQVMSLIEMKRPDLEFVLEQRLEVERGVRAHNHVLESLLSEIPEGFGGTVGSFLKKNPSSRALIETIVADYREDHE